MIGIVTSVTNAATECEARYATAAEDLACQLRDVGPQGVEFGHAPFAARARGF